MTHEAYPWTRRPDTAERRGESSQAYEGFRAYMNLGAVRSTRAVAEQLGKSDSLIRQWSARWDWPNRAAAYDSYLVTAKVDGEADELSRVRVKHLDVADKLLDHLRTSMDGWKPGWDPSIRWTSAFTAAAKVQQMALTLRETTGKAEEEAIDRIMKIMEKRAEG